MDKTNKQTNPQKGQKYPNPLEALKDLGTSTANTFKQDFIDKVPQDFMDQIFGPQPHDKRYSGEISVGESLEIDEVYTGVQEENHKLREQIAFERHLQKEEQIYIERKSNELRMQLKAITEEILKLTKQTGHLAEELEIAAIQAPANPGIYHIFFFEQLLEFLKSFTKKIQDASSWLHTFNKRASKKNVWGQNYKKSGGKYLLSGEHYLQRSAG